MRSSPALPASPLPAGSRPPAAARRPRLSSRRLWDALSHAYIWAVLVVFILPFLALVGFSFTTRPGEAGVVRQRREADAGGHAVRGPSGLGVQAADQDEAVGPAGEGAGEEDEGLVA